MRMRIYSFKIPDTLIDFLDKIVRKEGYRNRSEAVREILMNYIRENLLEGSEGSVIPIDISECRLTHLLTIHITPAINDLLKALVEARIFPDKASVIRRALRVYFEVEGFKLLAECNGGVRS